MTDLSKEYPANEGWEFIRIGNKTIAHNKWGGAREVVEVRELEPKRVKLPKSWAYKPRSK